MAELVLPIEYAILNGKDITKDLDPDGILCYEPDLYDTKGKKIYNPGFVYMKFKGKHQEGELRVKRINDPVIHCYEVRKP
jgi:hypothetical protein